MMILVYLTLALMGTYFGNFEECLINVGVVFGAGLQRFNHVVVFG